MKHVKNASPADCHRTRNLSETMTFPHSTNSKHPQHTIPKKQPTNPSNRHKIPKKSPTGAAQSISGQGTDTRGSLSRQQQRHKMASHHQMLPTNIFTKTLYSAKSRVQKAGGGEKQQKVHISNQQQQKNNAIHDTFKVRLLFYDGKKLKKLTPDAAAATKKTKKGKRACSWRLEISCNSLTTTRQRGTKHGQQQKQKSTSSSSNTNSTSNTTDQPTTNNRRVTSQQNSNNNNGTTTTSAASVSITSTKRGFFFFDCNDVKYRQISKALLYKQKKQAANGTQASPSGGKSRYSSPSPAAASQRPSSSASTTKRRHSAAATKKLSREALFVLIRDALFNLNEMLSYKIQFVKPSTNWNQLLFNEEYRKSLKRRSQIKTSSDHMLLKVTERAKIGKKAIGIKREVWILLEQDNWLPLARRQEPQNVSPNKERVSMYTKRPPKTPPAISAEPVDPSTWWALPDISGSQSSPSGAPANNDNQTPDPSHAPPSIQTSSSKKSKKKSASTTPTVAAKILPPALRRASTPHPKVGKKKQKKRKRRHSTVVHPRHATPDTKSAKITKEQLQNLLTESSASPLDQIRTVASFLRSTEDVHNLDTSSIVSEVDSILFDKANPLYSLPQSPNNGVPYVANGGDHSNFDHQLLPDMNSVLELVSNNFCVNDRRISSPSRGAPAVGEQNISLNSTTSTYLHDPHSREILHQLQKLDQWDFNVFQLDHLVGGQHLLLYVSYALFLKYDLLSKFQIRDVTFINFVMKVEDHYQSNPYHNALHAADSLHMAHYMVTPGELYEFLSDDDILALFLSIIVLDSSLLEEEREKRQNSSPFKRKQVDTPSDILFKTLCLRQGSSNIFSGMTLGQQTGILHSISDILLATERSHHTHLVHNFRNRIDSRADFRLDSNVKLVLQVCLRLCDLSYTMKPRKLYLRWIERVFYEYHLAGQQESEGEDAIQTTQLTEEREYLSNAQVGLISHLMSPLMEAFCELLPKMWVGYSALIQNKYYWMSKRVVE